MDPDARGCGLDVSERRGVVWISRELPEGEDVEVCVARCVDLKETFKKDRDEPRRTRLWLGVLG